MIHPGLDIALTGIFLGFLLFLVCAALEEIDAPYLIQKMNFILIGLCVVAIPVGFLMAIWGGK